jgi:hypothetical protein
LRHRNLLKIICKKYLFFNLKILSFENVPNLKNFKVFLLPVQF